jgi:hypothetical protein
MSMPNFSELRTMINIVKIIAGAGWALLFSSAFSAPGLLYEDSFPKLEAKPGLSLLHHASKLPVESAIPGSTFTFADLKQGNNPSLARFLDEENKKISAAGPFASSEASVAAKLPNLDNIVAAAVAAQLPDFKTSFASGPRVEITPQGHLTVDRSGAVRGYFYLKVVARSGSGDILWHNNYSYADPVARPWSGKEGWFGDSDGANRLSRDAEKIFPIMLQQLSRDMHQVDRRSDFKPIDLRHCTGDLRERTFLVRETPEMWILKTNEPPEYPIRTRFVSKISCQLAG